MNARLRSLHLAAAAMLLASLAACGGGGGSADASGSAPSSGPYAWILRAQGPTTSLTYGLSLLHASKPGTEFVIEFGSSVLTDTQVVSRASVDAGNLRTGTLQPYALVYIVGGDIRRVPLQADGSAPATRVQRAGTTDACKFLADAAGRATGAGVDYANPENSRFLVSTAGPDGQCGTADDGADEVRLSASAGLTVEAFDGTPLGYFRDAATLAPRGWIAPRSAIYWTSGSDAAVTLRSSTDPAFTSVVEAGPTSALVDDGTQLSALDLSVGTTPTETKLDTATTGGGGWLGIGFDAAAWYAYRNTGTGTSAAWSVLKVTRTSPHATVLASGTGQVTVASMGATLLYATVVDTGANSLLAISKSTGVPVQTLEQTASSTLTTVQTSASGVHELWRVVNIGTAALNYQIEFIDETGARVYTTSAGGFPIVSPEAAIQRFDTSESRTRFVFANGYGARAFGDATLMGFDAASRGTTTFGTLPGSSVYGTDTVYANASGGPGSLMGGFAARSAAGVIEADGDRVFSFDFDTAQSLAFTTLSD